MKNLLILDEDLKFLALIPIELQLINYIRFNGNLVYGDNF